MVSTRRMRDYEAATKIITSRLNMADPPAAIQRVADLLDLLREARLRKRLEGMERFQKFLESPVLREMVTPKLLSYAPRYYLGKDLVPGMVWNEKAVELLTAKDGPRTPWELIQDTEEWEAEEFEQMAVWFLFNKGHEERYRRCEVCNKWFYAITDHQAHCSKACRQKKSAKGDTFKHKRTVYMQVHRLRGVVLDLKAEIRVTKHSARRKRLKEKLAKVLPRLDDAETAWSALRGAR